VEVANLASESLAQIYGSLAHRYAQSNGINDFCMLPLVKRYCPPSATRALEVCCGAGGFAIEFAKRSNQFGELIFRQR
jgi:ubiquinone/menaquinone biosynthesis C-methylase UbiE